MGQSAWHPSQDSVSGINPSRAEIPFREYNCVDPIPPKGDRMTKSLMTAAAVLIAGSFAAQAQTFKVEKYDIKGDGGTPIGHEQPLNASKPL